jgi:hypothetical protein
MSGRTTKPHAAAIFGARLLEESGPEAIIGWVNIGRIGTAYATTHILPTPLAKPGDSGQTRTARGSERSTSVGNGRVATGRTAR